MKSMLKSTSTPVVLIILIAFFSTSWVAHQENTYDSVVVVKVNNLTSEQFNQVAASAGQKNDTNIDYYCLWSGVMVIKINNSHLHQTGDLHVYTKRLLNEAISSENVEILYVHSSVSGMAKC
jgi:hypothetical protein